MNEKLSTETTNESEDEREERLVHTLHYRMRFQHLVFEILNVNKNLDVNTRMDVIKKYSKMISDYIDNPINNHIRKLISDEKFSDAAEIMVAEIHHQESWPKAA